MLRQGTFVSYKKYNMDDKREKEFLKEVKKAARSGSTLMYRVQIALVVIALIAGGFVLNNISNKVENFGEKLTEFITFETEASKHDLVIEDDMIFGYTAADFQDAVLQDSSKLKKIEVFQQKISDNVELKDTGFLNWAIFSKCQLITYEGTAVYTVDMKQIKASDISLDDESKIVTIKIPRTTQENINILEEDILFGDVEKGLLAFGDIKMTLEQAQEIQKEARNKMQQKLNEMKVNEQADRFAKLVVWEMYSPIIKSVAKDYSLEVVFKN